MSNRKFGRNSTALDVVKGIDLTGKTVLITGTTSGIGLETARALAYHNAHVIMANFESAEEAKKSILEGYPNARIDIMYINLSKLKSVESCAAEFVSRGWPLHVLILNAGVYYPSEKITQDGFEYTFQVNYLAHFYLVQLLMPVILKSTPVRVVHVASALHMFGTFDPNDVTWEFIFPSNALDVPSVFSTYSKSKFCTVLFSNELQRRLGDKGVTSNSLHPVVVRQTQIACSTLRGRLFFKLPFVGTHRVITVDKGAATSVYAATAPELEGVGGKYLDVVQICKPSAKAFNEETAKKLWNLSEKMITKWKENEMTLKY